MKLKNNDPGIITLIPTSPASPGILADVHPGASFALMVVWRQPPAKTPVAATRMTSVVNGP